MPVPTYDQFIESLLTSGAQLCKPLRLNKLMAASEHANLLQPVNSPISFAVS